MSKTRNSNIEILRIISIIMIVASHYCVHGVGKDIIQSMNIGFNRFLLESSILGNLGSIIFILISGYYLSNSDEVKYKKIIHLLFQVFFYSILIYLIVCLTGINSFSIKSLINSLLPITFKEYWFATAYIILYIFHPYINRLLSTLNRKEFITFISILFIIFSCMSTFTTSDFYGNELIQFLMFYCIGAYLFKYPKNILDKDNNDYKILFISIALIILSIITFDVLGTKYDIFNKHSIYFLNITSPLLIMTGVTLFSVFSKKQVFENKLINNIGSLMFGVYLISDNQYIRPLLWGRIFKNVEYIYELYLIFHLLFTVIITIIICLLIESIRKLMIEKNLFKKIDKIIDEVQTKIHRRIDSKIFSN